MSWRPRDGLEPSCPWSQRVCFRSPWMLLQRSGQVSTRRCSMSCVVLVDVSRRCGDPESVAGNSSGSLEELIRPLARKNKYEVHSFERSRESGRTRTCTVGEGEVTRVEVQIIRRRAVPLVYALPASFTGLRSQVGAVRRVRSEVS